MSVRIRLRRMGAKKQPFFRVVVADQRSPRDGRFLDTIGTYDPRGGPSDIDIDRDKALKWLGDGAEPTDAARSLLSKTGIWQEFKTGEAPEPRPTPAEPAERTAPEPEVEEAPEEVAAEIEEDEVPEEEVPEIEEEEVPEEEVPEIEEEEVPEEEVPEIEEDEAAEEEAPAPEEEEAPAPEEEEEDEEPEERAEEK